MNGKRFLSAALLIVVALALCAAVIEGLCRAILPEGSASAIVADPVLGYRRAPLSRFVEEGESPGRVIVTTNRSGWRGPDRPAQKPENAFRVALIGDSYVESTAMDEAGTFGALAETALARASGRPVEVLNFGVSGYSPVQYLLVLRDHVLAARPDVAVLFYFPLNDLEAMTADTAPTRLAPFAGTTPDGGLALDLSFARSPAFYAKRAGLFLRRHLTSANFLYERLQRLRLARYGQEHHAEAALPSYLTLCASNPDPRFVRNARLLELLLDEAVRLCRENGVKLVLACVDYDGNTPRDAARLRALDPTVDPTCLERRARQWAQDRGVPFIGFQSRFFELTRETGKSYHWTHWNEEGHREVAKALTETLLPLVDAPANP